MVGMATDDQIADLAAAELEDRLNNQAWEETKTGNFSVRGASLESLDKLVQRARRRRRIGAKLIRPSGDI